MKIQKAVYLHDCVSCPDDNVAALINCIDTSIAVTRRTFLRHVCKRDLDDHADSMGYALHPAHGLTMSADPSITYHKSTFKGAVCYFFTWSGIEHLFTKQC